MKTNFTEIELTEFFTKISRELQGEALLLPSLPAIIDSTEMFQAMTNPTSFVELTANISKAQGEVIGKLELLKKILFFFEVIEETDF